MLKDITSYYDREMVTESFLITYQETLMPLKNKDVVKVFSFAIYRQDLLVQFKKELIEATPSIAKQSLRHFIDKCPNELKCTVGFKRNNPRIAYLIVNNLPKVDARGYGEYNLFVHPISLLTMNSWVFINNYLRQQLEKNHIPYKILEHNALTTKNTNRYGRNFLRFIGEWDLNWLSKPVHKNIFFTNEDDYLIFFSRELNINPLKQKVTYDQLYRMAILMADKSLLDKDIPNDFKARKKKSVDTEISENQVKMNRADRVDFQELVSYFWVKLKKLYNENKLGDKSV